MNIENTMRRKIDNSTLSFDELERMFTCFAASMFSGASESAFLRDLARNCIVHLGFANCAVYLLDEEKNLEMINMANKGAVL